ncbi:hypothetical protein BD311DRAFT_808762 [Dichomitus squalens]|nr:hypothetical protein BD311DRAFT_808762 [Dichomitus squalens]
MPRLQSFGYVALAVLSLAYAHFIPPVSCANSLQLTTIAGRNNQSTIECWTYSQDFVVAGGLNVQQLGDLTGATYIEVPTSADHTQGPYNPSGPQLFVILSGNATITFPDSLEVLHVKASQLYAAADTHDVSGLGHITTVKAGSKLVQFPFKDGVLPNHTWTPGECAPSLNRRDEL